MGDVLYFRELHFDRPEYYFDQVARFLGLTNSDL